MLIALSKGCCLVTSSAIQICPHHNRRCMLITGKLKTIQTTIGYSLLKWVLDYYGRLRLISTDLQTPLQEPAIWQFMFFMHFIQTQADKCFPVKPELLIFSDWFQLLKAEWRILHRLPIFSPLLLIRCPKQSKILAWWSHNNFLIDLSNDFKNCSGVMKVSVGADDAAASCQYSKKQQRFMSMR